MNFEDILVFVTKEKEFILFLITVISTIFLVIQKIGIYHRAKSYSSYYKIPMELFQKYNKLKFYENVILVLLLSFYLVAPFVFSKMIGGNWSLLIFVFLFNFLYWVIISIGFNKNFDFDKNLFFRDLAIAALVTLIFYITIKFKCIYLLILILIYFGVITVTFLLSAYKMYNGNNPSPQKCRTFYVIEKENIKDLKINIDQESMLLIVDYYNDDKMIVLECVEEGEHLRLKSKYWIIAIENVGMTKKENITLLPTKLKSIN